MTKCKHVLECSSNLRIKECYSSLCSDKSRIHVNSGVFRTSIRTCGDDVVEGSSATLSVAHDTAFEPDSIAVDDGAVCSWLSDTTRGGSLNRVRSGQAATPAAKHMWATGTAKL